MKYFAVACLIANVALARKYVTADLPCHKHNPNKGAPVIKTPLIPRDDLPDQWIWNSIDDVNYLT